MATHIKATKLTPFCDSNYIEMCSNPVVLSNVEFIVSGTRDGISGLHIYNATNDNWTLFTPYPIELFDELYKYKKWPFVKNERKEAISNGIALASNILTSEKYYYFIVGFCGVRNSLIPQSICNVIHSYHPTDYVYMFGNGGYIIKFQIQSSQFVVQKMETSTEKIKMSIYLSRPPLDIINIDGVCHINLYHLSRERAHYIQYDTNNDEISEISENTAYGRFVYVKHMNVLLMFANHNEIWMYPLYQNVTKQWNFVKFCRFVVDIDELVITMNAKYVIALECRLSEEKCEYYIGIFMIEKMEWSQTKYVLENVEEVIFVLTMSNNDIHLIGTDQHYKFNVTEIIS